jgi:hypothetical protein
MDDINLNRICTHIFSNINCKKCGIINTKNISSIIPKMYRGNSEYIDLSFQNSVLTKHLFDHYLYNRNIILNSIKSAFRKVNYSDETFFLCMLYMDNIFSKVKDYSQYEKVIIGSVVLSSTELFI